MNTYMVSFNNNGNRFDKLDNVGFFNKDYWLICKYNKVDESLTVILSTYIDNPELVGNILKEIKHTIDCGGWT